jgi:hypothetical protein
MSNITEKEITEALRQPSDFGLSSHAEHSEEMFVTWSLGPVIRHRDSNLLDQVNADALEKHLHEDHPELEDEWCITSCNHWAVGWVDHLSFHAVNEKREPTKMFEVLTEWSNSLADYPCADDDDLSKREYENTLENITNEGTRFVVETAPLTWAEDVFGWLWDNDQEEVDPKDGFGGYPSQEAIKKALSALGWLEKEDEDEAVGGDSSLERRRG